jgi:hypothetical protein
MSGVERPSGGYRTYGNGLSVLPRGWGRFRSLVLSVASHLWRGLALDAVSPRDAVGRIHIEKIEGPFLFAHGGGPAEYGEGLTFAIERGWLWKHESGLCEVHAGWRAAVRLSVR